MILGVLMPPFRLLGVADEARNRCGTEILGDAQTGQGTVTQSQSFQPANNPPYQVVSWRRMTN